MAKPEALESHESLRAPTVVESSMAHSRARSTLFGDSSVRVDLRGFRSAESPPPSRGSSERRRGRFLRDQLPRPRRCEIPEQLHPRGDETRVRRRDSFASGGGEPRAPPYEEPESTPPRPSPSSSPPPRRPGEPSGGCSRARAGRAARRSPPRRGACRPSPLGRSPRTPSRPKSE